jgi:hypothetical protein
MSLRLTIILVVSCSWPIPAFTTCIGIERDRPDDAVRYEWMWIPPNPWTIISNGYNDNILYVWDELQNITLSEPLFVDWVTDPTADYVVPLEKGYYIREKTIVSSHYVQWDPANAKSVSAILHFYYPGSDRRRSIPLTQKTTPIRRSRMAGRDEGGASPPTADPGLSMPGPLTQPPSR